MGTMGNVKRTTSETDFEADQLARREAGYEVEGVNPRLAREARQNLATSSPIRPGDVRHWQKHLMSLGVQAATSVEAAENLAKIWKTVEICMNAGDHRTKLSAAKLGVEYMRVWNELLTQCQNLANAQGPAQVTAGGPVTVEKAIMLINRTTGGEGPPEFLEAEVHDAEAMPGDGGD